MGWCLPMGYTYVKLWAGVCPWDIHMWSYGLVFSMGYTYVKLWAGVCPWDIRMWNYGLVFVHGIYLCEAMGWCLSMGYTYVKLWAGVCPWDICMWSYGLVFVHGIYVLEAMGWYFSMGWTWLQISMFPCSDIHQRSTVSICSIVTLYLCSWEFMCASLHTYYILPCSLSWACVYLCTLILALCSSVSVLTCFHLHSLVFMSTHIRMLSCIHTW